MSEEFVENLPNQVSKATFLDKIKRYWETFSSVDRRTKASLVVMGLFLLATPLIVSQNTNLFSHAGISLFNSCTPIPSGISQEQIQQLSQSGKVRWCKPTTVSTKVPVPRITATPICTNKVSTVRFSWEPVSGAQAYVLNFWGTMSGQYNEYQVQNVTGTSITLPNAQYAIKHIYGTAIIPSLTNGGFIKNIIMGVSEKVFLPITISPSIYTKPAGFITASCLTL